MKHYHVAIMKKSWGLLPKILNGSKKIESRWYMNKSRPWGHISAGDEIYFKDSGEPVTLKAVVDKILSFPDLTPEKVRDILERYGKDDGIAEGDVPYYYNLFKNKKYCLLIFLKDIAEVVPFNVDKTGFGAMSAWLTFEKPLFVGRQSFGWVG